MKPINIFAHSRPLHIALSLFLVGAIVAAWFRGTGDWPLTGDQGDKSELAIVQLSEVTLSAGYKSRPYDSHVSHQTGILGSSRWLSPPRTRSIDFDQSFPASSSSSNLLITLLTASYL